jgi:GalNAc-alpha-(1->4)-GalNAc-alpha-(1->3)-diNAcBac-PP-undecaprenol alpha-1,4-N-acetyl-D-galactosaminyltransferase
VGGKSAVKIAFVIPTLGPGGAERVASLLCNFWAAQGHGVSLVTFEAASSEPFQDIQDKVAIRRLNAFNSTRSIASLIRTNTRRIVRLRLVLRRLHPDVIVAFMTEAAVIATCAAQGLNVPIVISERNQPDRPGLGPAHRLARRMTYGLADAMVAQTAEIAAWARARFRIPVFVVPNPVSLKQYGAAARRSADDESRLLVSIGRLTHQKGYDILIKSFSALAEQYPGWGLRIYGEGPERGALEGLIKERGLENRIKLPGIRRDVTAALAEASVFVLASRYEGYPNALLEALTCGLPVIATDCPGANAEILAQGNYGMLVPADDDAILTTALHTMMSAPDLRATYSSRAREAVADLDLGRIGQRWLELFEDVIEQRKAEPRRH